MSQLISSLAHLLVAAFQRPYAHFTVITLVVLLVTLYFLVARIRKLWDQLWRKWHPPSPFDPRLLTYYKNAAYWWGFLVLLGLLFFSLALYLARYQFLGRGVELAGTARVQGGSVFYVNYNGGKIVAHVKGPEVAAAGVFLRFPSWMRFLGLETYHKMITFRGNLENKYHYQKPEADFLAPYVDRFYFLLYKHRKDLGVVEPFYTESPYFSGNRRIFVTHSGYIIQS